MPRSSILISACIVEGLSFDGDIGSGGGVVTGVLIFQVIISNNDEMALGAIEAIKGSLGSDIEEMIPVFGIDATRYALAALSENELKGTVLNEGISQARGVVDIAIALVRSGGTEGISNPEKGRYCRVPYKKISKDDIG